MATPKPIWIVLWTIDELPYQVTCKQCGLKWPITFTKEAWFCKACNKRVEVVKEEFNR